MYGAKKVTLLLIFIGLHITTTQAAENCRSEDSIEFRGITARLENDLFTNTDQNYTNGVAITAVSRDMGDKLRTECLPLPFRLHSRLIKTLTPDFWNNTNGTTATHNVVVKIGQSMFTPKDPLRNDLIENDRPYAGILYVGMSWNKRQNIPQKNLEMLDTREITLGVIGPWSFAKEAQNVVHEVIGVDRFHGWDHQLKNEPAIQLAMDKKFKNYQSNEAIIADFSADAIRSIGLRLGNIETSASFGIEGRVGWNLPNDFGSYTIRPGAENRPPSTPSIHSVTNTHYTGIHLFSTLETKFVARDFSLDGNLFRPGPHVTRRPWVGLGAIGLSIQSLIMKRGYKLAVMRVYRTREFEEQSSYHAYGSIALSVEF